MFNMYYWLMIVLLIFAAGDMISHRTKGAISGLMVVLLSFLVLFLANVLPKDIIDQAGLTQVAAWGGGMVMFNLGTTVNFKQMIKEWRVVVVAAITLVATCLMMLVVSPIVGLKTTLAGMPIMNGGAFALMIVTQAAAEKGNAIAVAVAVVIYSIQKFVGTPIATKNGIKYAKKLQEEYRKDPAAAKASLGLDGKGANGKVAFWKQHEEWYSTNVLLGIVGVESKTGS